MFMPIAPPSIDAQQGMQVISDILGVIDAPPHSETSTVLSIRHSLFACTPSMTSDSCFAEHTFPIIILSFIFVLLVVIPILVYFEHRKVLAWMEARRRAGLPTDAPSIAIEMRVLDMRRTPVRQEIEVYV
ncbi:hypothetical protein C8F04DRAFT_1268784 [Mycena alexandri]|uniref:Uncharacterized protein n=1 Tax=Mycena alexandri TaxID=1745969 RepID=A0AAD6SDS6_9AGAR|nr:hypothetical protein C8F04DRAFT_1268784 [Mycena alexandri]